MTEVHIWREKLAFAILKRQLYQELKENRYAPVQEHDIRRILFSPEDHRSKSFSQEAWYLADTVMIMLKENGVNLD